MIGEEGENEIVTCGDLKFKKLFPEEQILTSISSIANNINHIFEPILKNDQS